MEQSNVELRLFPRPKEAERGAGEFFFGRRLYLHIGRKYIEPFQVRLFKELFSNFTAGSSRLKVIEHDTAFPAAILSEDPNQTVPTADGLEEMEYCLFVDTHQVTMLFRDAVSLSHAMCSMLSLIEIRDTKKPLFTLPVCRIRDTPTIGFRGIHVCVFPETRYLLLKKFIRLIGFTKYSHVVLEFWGTFRYKCCAEMSGKNALSARQVKALVREANALGVEVIPMLNVLGHASQSRAIYGKHTTLDRNPKLAPLFEPDGWTWNILNPDTLDLLKEMRRELCDACGTGSYFHLGCDESFPYGSSRLFDGKDKAVELYRYLNGIADELEQMGRRAIIWGDQMLNEPGRFREDCITYGETPEIARKLIENLDRRIIIDDWQYYVKQKNVPTAEFFAEEGFDVILAPFDFVPAVGICADDVITHGYYGFMQTTWHLMHGADFRLVLRGATFAWEGNVELTKADIEFMGFESASYLRRLLPPKGIYRNSGLREKQIEV